MTTTPCPFCHPAPERVFVQLDLVSALWDVFIPANLGGDAYRIRQAAAHGGLLRSGTTVIWDRALGSLTQLMLGGSPGVNGPKSSRLRNPCPQIRHPLWP